jgi:hypothetical protein
MGIILEETKLHITFVVSRNHKYNGDGHKIVEYMGKFNPRY